MWNTTFGRRAWALAAALLPALGVAALAVRDADAQQARPRAGGAARTFELRPREGLTQQFEDGYRRHLAVMAATEQVRRELWRFRPDLSTCRMPAARCHRTLGAGTSGR